MDLFEAFLIQLNVQDLPYQRLVAIPLGKPLRGCLYTERPAPGGWSHPLIDPRAGRSSLSAAEHQPDR